MGASQVSAVNAIADTLGGGNSVTAPGAGSSFTSIAAPPAGKYRIRFGIRLSGTTETTLANGQLRVNNATLLGSLPTITGPDWLWGEVDQVTLDGVQPVQLRASAAATGGAVYSGIILLTRVG